MNSQVEVNHNLILCWGVRRIELACWSSPSIIAYHWLYLESYYPTTKNLVNKLISLAACSSLHCLSSWRVHFHLASLTDREERIIPRTPQLLLHKQGFTIHTVVFGHQIAFYTPQCLSAQQGRKGSWNHMGPHEKWNCFSWHEVLGNL